MLSSNLSPKQTITCSAKKMAFSLDKIEETNAYLGAIVEFSIKNFGYISQFSYVDHDCGEYQSSFNSGFL